MMLSPRVLQILKAKLETTSVKKFSLVSHSSKELKKRNALTSPKSAVKTPRLN